MFGNINVFRYVNGKMRIKLPVTLYTCIKVWELKKHKLYISLVVDSVVRGGEAKKRRETAKIDERNDSSVGLGNGKGGIHLSPPQTTARLDSLANCFFFSSLVELFFFAFSPHYGAWSQAKDKWTKTCGN